MADETPQKQLSLEDMMALRPASESISKWLQSELEDRLETIRPLLLPRRLLGRHLKTASTEEVKGADRAFQSLQEAFKGAAGEPFRLSGKLESPIPSMTPGLSLSPWEYAYQLAEGETKREVIITSPASWHFSYPAPLNLGQVRKMLSSKEGRNTEQLQQFMVSNVMMKVALERNGGIKRLLSAMRVAVEEVTLPETGKLPLTKLSYPVPVFRPGDGLISNATKLAGVDRFGELVDVEAVAAIQDPLQVKLSSLAAKPTS